MIRSIHLTARFNRRLACFDRAGKKSGLAARKARAIIDGIARCGAIPPAFAAETTRHGEKRIRGCVKYDLGGGYRMVTVKQADLLYVVFAGTHDETDRWLANRDNRRVGPMVETGGRTLSVNPGRPDGPARARPRPAPPSDGFSDLSATPDDKLLRRIFSGLVGCRQGGDAP